MNNYSFIDFITKEIVIDEEKDEKIQIDTIKIPMIQRDYAQGRKILDDNQQEHLNEKGQKFLDNIFEKLELNEEMELDFIYGSIDDKSKEFEPLDGQQRLTMLFLLYWYIGSRELIHDSNEYKELMNHLSKFTYATRATSRRFCELICNPNKTSIDLNNEPAEQIKKLSWFYKKAYIKDPTINAMLFMLDAIHSKYNLLGQNNIFPNLERLRFYPFPLNGFDLTEDLYIKMNARGKELTPFENFKADFIKWMQNKGINGDSFYEEKEYHSISNMPYHMIISNKIDNEWTDFFWTITKDNDEKEIPQQRKSRKELEKPTVLVDPYFMRLISRFFLNIYLADSDVEANTIDKTPIYTKLLDSINYSSFDVFSDFLNIEKINRLENVFDKLAMNWAQIEPYCKASWESGNKYFWEQEITNKDQIMLYAITSYLEKNDFNKIAFSQWMRVTFNIMENADIDSVRVMTGCIRYFKSISQYSSNIYESFAKENIDKTFATKQVEEEIIKAKKIINNPNEAWEDEFKKAEAHEFFRGCIGFMLDNSILLTEFIHRYDNFKEMFEKNGVSARFRKDHVLLRALIKNYTEYKDFYANTNHFTDKDEKEHFLKKKLVDDNTFISTLKRYADMPTLDDIEKAAKIDSQTKSKLNVPSTWDPGLIVEMRKIHDSFNDIELLNWMENEKAIRFNYVNYHYYISAPGSWYSWIMLDSDRAKYHDLFISKGFTTVSEKVGKFLTRKELVYMGTLNNSNYVVKFLENGKVRFYREGEDTPLEELEYKNDVDISDEIENNFFLRY